MTTTASPDAAEATAEQEESIANILERIPGATREGRTVTLPPGEILIDHAMVAADGVEVVELPAEAEEPAAPAELASDPPAPPERVVTATPVTLAELNERVAELRARQAAQSPEVERMNVRVVTASGEVEVPMAVRWDDEAWDEYKFNPETGRLGAKGAFVSTLPEGMSAAGDGVAQIVDNPGASWHAILCVEGLRTDEDPGRLILPGACQFPDLPVSLRLQIHDEGGHYGAVSCGRIDAMDRQDMDGYNAIAGQGVFGTDEHGQTGQLLVSEQTQRFISIDPRNVTMEIITVEVSRQGIYDVGYDDESELEDWWLQYAELTIGAATIVATPALQQAVITLADVPLPETPIAVANAQGQAVVVADGGPLEPPSAWFLDPGFHVGDPRLHRQRDGKYACPLTVTDDGQVFGHACYWGQRHTARPDKTPPHSKTNYAHYLTGGGIRCEDGSTIYGVGQVTMGCGHPPLDWSNARAKAHYDGGYGAVQVADVVCGEDDFGLWVAGAMRSDLTPEQVRAFKATNLSGDWRPIPVGGRNNPELHAILAGVPVPGFPISREVALVASGEDAELELAAWNRQLDSYACRATYDEDGAPLALVAAGRVERISLVDQVALMQRALDTLLRERSERLALEGQAALRELVGV